MKKGSYNWGNIAKTILGLSIIGLLIINKVAFVHSHKLPDGTLITHCHPFNKNDTSPFKHHHHSNATLFLLYNLQLFSFAAGLILGIIVLRIIGLIFQNKTYKNSWHFRNNLSPRAPPKHLPQIKFI